MISLCNSRIRAFYLTSLLITGAAGFPSATFAETLSIQAEYGIEFGGLEIGKFHFSSNVENQAYSLAGHSKISFMGSWFEWKAEAKSSGLLKDKDVKPAFFSYELKGDKKKNVEVTFPKPGDTAFKISPELETSDKRVPVKPEDLKGSIDPMSGLILLTQKPAQGPDKSICEQNVPVFDGKERYDIQLVFKRMKVVELNDSTRKTAVVCQLKYEPVAGHKKDGKTQKFLKNSSDILVWLVPFPKGNMYVPHRIEIPTPLGTATVVSRKFDLKRTGEDKVVSFQ